MTPSRWQRHDETRVSRGIRLPRAVLSRPGEESDHVSETIMAVGGKSQDPVGILAPEHKQHKRYVQNIDEKGPNLQGRPDEEHRRADKLSGKENAPRPCDTARVNMEFVRQWAPDVDSSPRECCLAARQQRPAKAQKQGRISECVRDAGRSGEAFSWRVCPDQPEAARRQSSFRNQPGSSGTSEAPYQFTAP